MGVKRVSAKTAVSARRKATTKHSTVGSVQRVKGSKRKGGMSSYSVRTHRKMNTGGSR